MVTSVSESPNSFWSVRCDGGSRGNPGPGAYAFVLADASGQVVEARGEYLGTVTNNVAEYRALIAGLESAAQHGAPKLMVYMDSELVVRQMTGEYRVKNAGLKPLHEQARATMSQLPAVTFRTVRREENAAADRLVNETLDRARSSESPR